MVPRIGCLLAFVAGPISGGEDVGFALRLGDVRYLSIPFRESMRVDGAITIEARIKLHRLPHSNDYLLVKSDSNGEDYAFGFSRRDTLRFLLPLDGRARVVEAKWPFALCRWYHIAATFDGQDMRIFLDGEQLAILRRVGPIRTSSGAIRVGANGTFTGVVDQIRLWNVARSADELKAFRASAVPPDTPGLMAQWLLDEGTGQTAFDDSPSGNHGTLGESPAVEAADPIWVRLCRDTGTGTIRVPDECEDIQEAVDTAPAGASVLVAPGRYLIWNPLSLGAKAVSLRSEAGPEGTVLERAGSYRLWSGMLFLFDGEGRGSIVQGFTLTGGRGGYYEGTNATPTRGGAIFIQESSPTIRDNIIEGNVVDIGGGGIYCTGGAPRIAGNRVLSNRVTLQRKENEFGQGGGILAIETDGEFEGNTIEDNEGPRAGGIYVSAGDTQAPRITGNAVRSNRATFGRAGGVSVLGPVIVVENRIVGNEGVDGGGLAAVGPFRVERNLIERNRATVSGGGAWIYGETGSEFSDNEVRANRCDRDGGGAMVPVGPDRFAHNRFDGNVAAQRGGGIRVEGLELVLQRCAIVGNVALSGGGVSAWTSGPVLTVIESIVVGNRAGKGDALFMEAGTCRIARSDVIGSVCTGGPPVTCSDTAHCGRNGNLCVDPLFIDPGRWLDCLGDPADCMSWPDGSPHVWVAGDFHLEPSSPLIDAGDPASSPDPDKTRADVGPFFFDQTEHRRFRRGDVNGDRSQDLGDPVMVLNYLFASGVPPTCLKAADSDDSGALELGDAISLLNYMFANGPAPKDPFAMCSIDPSPDALGCESYAGCGGS